MLIRLRTLFVAGIVILGSIMLGYALRVYHEGKIRAHYQSQAEKEMITLEEEFYSAWKKPRTFFIFNGRFEVYPVRESERTFCYREARGTDFINQDSKLSKNAENKPQE